MTAVSAAAVVESRPRIGTLAVLLSGTFLIVLDFFIVNVAIPSIERDLHAGTAAIEWIVAGYALAFGAMLVNGGRLGDAFGRRRVFSIGIALFGVASAGCALAWRADVLVALRVVQGVAAALLGPQVLTILGTTYAGEARDRAFAAYGIVMGVAATFGQVFGGVLIALDPFGWGWRSCFLVNVPIGIVALLLTPRFVPESRSPSAARLDVGGAVLAALTVVAVVYPLIEGRHAGWPLWTWCSFAAGSVLYAAFIAYERRLAARGAMPLLPPALLRERAFTAGLLAQSAFYSCQASLFLILALYAQLGRGLSALGAGFLFVPLGFGYLATSLWARRAAARFGRQTIAIGALVRAAGVTALVFVVLYGGTSAMALFAVPLLLDGAGEGLALVPLVSTVLARMTPQDAGAASGALSTAAQLGNALGVAVVGTIFAAVLGGATTSPAYAQAFAASAAAIVVALIVLVVLVQAIPRRSPPPH